MEEFKGLTQSGFAFRVPKSRLDNMELVDALAALAGDNPLALSQVVRLLLGDEQRGRLYDHLRRQDGTVSVESVTDAIKEILDACGETGKN